jgi:hypothetical protein
MSMCVDHVAINDRGSSPRLLRGWSEFVRIRWSLLPHAWNLQSTPRVGVHCGEHGEVERVDRRISSSAWDVGTSAKL